MIKLGMEKITNNEKVLSPLSLLSFVFGILQFFPTELFQKRQMAAEFFDFIIYFLILLKSLPTAFSNNTNISSVVEF